MSGPDQPVVLTPDQVREWLGTPRFERYLSAAGGDPGRALALYEWNSHLAAAALRDVGHFEVAMRNAYDEQLSQRFPDWAADPASGLFRLESGRYDNREPQRRLNAGSVAKLGAARAGLGGSAAHGQVVAAMDFGFWTQLTARERTETVWAPMLSRAYPAGTKRAEVHGLVVNVNRFRNRLAHNEPVFSTKAGLVDRMENTETLFRLLRPEAAEWVRQHSECAAVDRPLPGARFDADDRPDVADERGPGGGAVAGQRSRAGAAGQRVEIGAGCHEEAAAPGFESVARRPDRTTSSRNGGPVRRERRRLQFEQIIEPVRKETEGIENWCTERAGVDVSTPDAIKEATQWLDKLNEDTGIPRRESFKTPSPGRYLVHRMQIVAREMSEQDIAERKRREMEVAVANSQEEEPASDARE